MGKTVNLTIRVTPQMKLEAEKAADYLDLSLSQVVRDAFKQIIYKAGQEMMRIESFRRSAAEYGFEGLPMTAKQESEFKQHGIDTTQLSRQQRRALERAARSGKLGKSKPITRTFKDDALENIADQEATGLISKERADYLRNRFEVTGE